MFTVKQEATIDTVATDGIEYSESNRNIAAENYVSGLQYAFRANGNKNTRFEVYYDNSEGAKRGEWKVDGKDNVTIRINGAKVRGAESAAWVLSHELFHSAAKNNPGIVNRVLETFEKIGIYDSSKFEAYKEAYRAEYEAAYKGRLDSGEITREQYDELVNNYVREEIAADLMMDVMGNEELANMFAQNSTKEDLNFIARFFRRFIDAIKKVFGDSKKYQQYVYDAEKLLGVFERAVKADGNKKNSVTETRSAVLGNNSITQKIIEAIRLIGPKSINKFTSDDIKIAEPLARRMFKALGVKSPFFRAWFGDWRANDRLPVEPVRFAYGENGKINYKKRNVKCFDMDSIILIDDNVVEDSIHYAKINGDEKQIRKLLSKVDEILAKGILIDTKVSIKTSGNKKGSTQFMHYLYTPILINDAPFVAKLAVEEYDIDGKRRAYNLQRIEMSELSRAQFQQIMREDREKYAYNSDSISISNLFRLVKTYDKKFSPKEPSKVVNADGTPKIVYHGTDADFDVFLPGQAGGIYFAGDRNVAEKYSKTGKVKEVYLDIKKPLVIDALVESEFMGMTSYKQSFYYEIPTPSEMREAGYTSETVSTEEIVKYARESGKYDGIIIDNVRESDGDVTTDYIVFSSTQVKSATDNIGTFDSNDQNTRNAVSSTPANENSVFDDKQRKDVIRKLSAVAKQNGVARLDKDSFVTDAMGILESALDTGIVSDGVVDELARCLYDYSREDAG